MSLREEFCRLALGPGANVRALCARFGIGPATAYKWLGRYRRAGVEGLADRSRRPASSPFRLPAELEGRIVAVRAEHPCWGGRKIRRVLENQGVADAPAISTITAVLRRHGLIAGPGEGGRRAWTRFEHAAPNDLWQMDFKGPFDLAGRACHPLTVLDDHSRYALEIGACVDQRGPTVRARLEGVFARYGLPWRILCDNGPPWGTAGHGEHSRLSVWLMDLDIAISHGRPYHPQTQGKDERFHRTLKGEVLAGRAFRDIGQAQDAFEAWRAVYNTVRPHEGIGLQTPSERYRMSPRSMPQAIEAAQYEPQAQVRTVDANGGLAFKGRVFKASKAFAGKRLALRATQQDGRFDLCYRRHVLAQVDLRQDVAKTVHHVPEQVFTLSPA
jgi:transposase InsO family protein